MSTTVLNERFGSKLEKFKLTDGGEKFTALCPCHPDKKNSLSGYINAKGNISIKCHAGCDWEAVLNQIGLKKSDLMLGETILPTKYTKPKSNKIEAVYQYNNEAGELLFETVRFEGKDFKQRRYEGKNCVWNLQGVQTTIYNLPDIKKAVGNHELICICEGEKDCDNLIYYGYHATTSPMGAGKWKPEYNQYFKNADIAIFKDNDIPGINHANEIFNNLSSIAKSIKIIDLKGIKDISDFIQLRKNAGRDNKTFIKSEIENLISKTPIKGKYTSYADVDNMVSGLSYSWDKWLPNGFVTTLAGAPESGKSFLALKIAQSFVTGIDFPDGDKFKGEKGYCLLCDTEAGQALWNNRIKNLDLSSYKFITPLEGALDSLSLDNKVHRKALTEKAKLDDVKIIIIDSLSGSSSSDENSTAAAEKVKFLAELARDTNKPVLVIHHLNKPNRNQTFVNETVGLDRLRGSSAIGQYTRVVWVIERLVSNPKPRTLKMIKSNFGAVPDPLAFEFEEDDIKFLDVIPKDPVVTTKMEEAKSFILREITEKREISASYLEELALNNNISKKTFDRAKTELKSKDFRIKDITKTIENKKLTLWVLNSVIHE
ncbi:AAA family ATPase [Candidatus Dojkabacteria bacterium]|nr:AAA family ATPase [Candidatus Dojkabacteria bacterium]